MPTDMLDYHVVFPHLEEHPNLPDVFDRLPELQWDALFASMLPLRQGSVHPTAVVADRVSIGEGTVVHPFAVIEDNVIIGKNCEIRSHVLIRSGTFISDGCVVGHGSEVKHAFLAQGVKLQGHCFVGDSIIGKGARIGTGCVVANRRFDQSVVAWRGPDGLVETKHDKLGALIGDYARLGAHVTTNPGIIIGAYTWISSGNVVTGFIDEERFITFDGRNVPNEHALDLADQDVSGDR